LTTIEGKLFRELWLEEKTIAIKVLDTANLKNTFNISLEQLLSEAEVLQGLKHTNILEIYSVVKILSNYLYIIMEYLEGRIFNRMLGNLRIQNKKLDEIQAKNSF
jgi:serine/threonine protein kinase